MTRMNLRKPFAILISLIMMAQLVPIRSFAAYSGDLGEYTLESGQIVFDESLQGYLFDNISPANFNLFMVRMAMGYDAMLDLVGGAPMNGQKITIKICSTLVGRQHMHPGQPYICWPTTQVVGILKEIHNDIDNWWFAGTIHELGHIFDDNGEDTWNFHSEGWASFKAFYAIEKLGGKTDEGKSVMEHINGWSIWPNYATLLNDYNVSDACIKAFVHTLFVNDPSNYLDYDAASFERGWNTLSQVFRSYSDPTYPASEPANHLSDRERRLTDFIERIAYVLEMDVDTYLAEYGTEFTQKLHSEKIPPKKVSGDWEYTIINNQVVVTKYTGTSAIVNIPQSFEGINVVKLGERSFRENKFIKTVIIPNTVTTIGIDGWFPPGAFQNSTLEEIVLPDSVTFLGCSTFAGCKSLKKVTFPKNFTLIPDWCFDGAFQGNPITSFELPDGIKRIEHYAFWGVGAITLTIPDSVTFINDTAFDQRSANFTICCSTGSYAHTYALNKNIKLCLCDDKPTPSPGVGPTPSPGIIITPPPAGCNDNCVDYNNQLVDVIVTSSGTPKINLSNESLDLAGFVPAEFSIDGGTKWKNAKADTFGGKKFEKMLNKGMTLHLKDAGGSTVTFPVVNPRPKPKLAINYEIAASSGAFGQWVLTEKKGTTVVKTNIQIGVAGLNDKGKPGKMVDLNGWGKFQTIGGVCVKPIGEKKGKPAVVKTVYFYRVAPSDEGGFTPGSVQKKVSATSLLKPVKYKVGTNKAKADKTYVNGALYAKKTELTLAAGDQVWHGATVKKPATARQTVG